MYTRASLTETITPNLHDTEIARVSELILSEFNHANKQDNVHVNLHTEGCQDVQFVLPRAAVLVLLNALQEMAKGNAVSLVPNQAEMTTQQGANLLCVSRPYFVRLLDEGKIPFHKAGSFRRVKAVDVLEYIRNYQQNASKAMREMVAESQAANLYE